MLCMEKDLDIIAVVISLSLVNGSDGRGKALPKFDGDFKPSFVVEGEFCFSMEGCYGGWNLSWRWR